MDVIQLLCKYARLDSASIERTPGKKAVHPSSLGQITMIKEIREDLLQIGLSADKYNINTLGDGSLLVQFPATDGCENAPHSCFVAHVDTYPGCPGAAKPIFHQYTGGDIVLPHGGVIIPAADLKGLEGKTIITSDGTSLLGGDDKNGCAAIVRLIEIIISGHLPHGPLTFWFCVDEEIAEVGTKFLPKEVAEQLDVFWTVDGIDLNQITTSCFNGLSINVDFFGVNAHPGVYGSKLCPAQYAACRFVSMLADIFGTPWNTTGEQPFLYAAEMPTGTAGKSTVKVDLRTFDRSIVRRARKIIRNAASSAAKDFRCTSKVKRTKIEYISTDVAINDNKDLLQPGLDALTDFGVVYKIHRERAGTDGAMANLSYPKLPAPDIGTGAGNLHGLTEFVVEEDLRKLPEILANMVMRYAKMIRKPRR